MAIKVNQITVIFGVVVFLLQIPGIVTLLHKIRTAKPIKLAVVNEDETDNAVQNLGGGKVLTPSHNVNPSSDVDAVVTVKCLTFTKLEQVLMQAAFAGAILQLVFVTVVTRLMAFKTGLTIILLLLDFSAIFAIINIYTTLELLTPFKGEKDLGDGTFEKLDQNTFCVYTTGSRAMITLTISAIIFLLYATVAVVLALFAGRGLGEVKVQESINKAMEQYLKQNNRE